MIQLRNIFPWSLTFFSALLLIQCTMETPSPSLKLNHQSLQKHIWVSVDSSTQSGTRGHHTRKLVFTGQKRFEIRETFKFSGSTFKNPGKYIVRDSMIQLHSMDGQRNIGNITLHNHHQLRVEWIRPGAIHHHDTEIYRPNAACGEDKKRTFTTTVFQAFSLKNLQ